MARFFGVISFIFGALAILLTAYTLFRHFTGQFTGEVGITILVFLLYSGIFSAIAIIAGLLGRLLRKAPSPHSRAANYGLGMGLFSVAALAAVTFLG